MANYYFLAASLPPLALGEKPEITFNAFKTMAFENLNKRDQEKMAFLLRIVDLENARAHLKGFPLDPRGNLNEMQLNEALLTQSDLPEYFFEFLSKYKTKEDVIAHFPFLFATYFAEGEKEKGFVKRFLELERSIRLVLAALRAKEGKQDIVKQLQFEEFSDFLVADILAQKDVENYEPPMDYKRLKEIFVATRNDPLERYQKIEQYRFEAIGDLVDQPLFSIDWILAYMLQLIIVERMWELDQKKAEVVFEKLTAIS